MLRQFSIKHRLIALFSIIVFAIVTATTARAYLNDEHVRLSEFLMEATATSAKFEELREAMGDIRRYEKDFAINYGDSVEQERYLKLWNKEVEHVQQVLTELQDRYPHESLPGMKKNISLYTSEANNSFLKAVALQSSASVINDDLKEAKGHMRETEKLRDVYVKHFEEHIKKQHAEVKAKVIKYGRYITGFILGIFGILVIYTYFVFKSINAPIQDVISTVKIISEKDFTKSSGSTDKDEPAEILRSLDQMRSNLNSALGQVHSSIDSVSTAASEISIGNNDLATRTEQTAASLQETNSSLQSLTEIVKFTETSAKQADNLARQAAQIATTGGEVVSNVVKTMNEITVSSHKIVEIISTINSIAFQTNILSLNAAVEAARAGSEGRGFAVVATEVRNLAKRSAEAAKEIETLINESSEKVQQGAKYVADAGATMTDIVKSVKNVTDIMTSITESTSQQSVSISEVGKAMDQLDKMTQQNAALVEESAAAAESLKDQASSLAATISEFKVTGTEFKF